LKCISVVVGIGETMIYKKENINLS
jgi:hypothetical protein